MGHLMTKQKMVRSISIGTIPEGDTETLETDDVDPVDLLPDLVVSEEDNYWQTGTFTKVTAGTADVTVDETPTKNKGGTGLVEPSTSRDGMHSAW
jgi:hypothetical protein